MFKRVTAAFVGILVMVCLLGEAEASDIVVVDDCGMTAFFGFYGSSLFADQPEILWDDTVAWAVGNATPSDTEVLLFTFDGTLSDANPANVNAIGFFNLLTSAGYSVSIDNQLNFATRTSYSAFDLAIFPNFGYSDANAPPADNVIGAGIPFITMEPAHSDELGIGTGVTVFSGTVDRGFVVDNDHAITDEYGLGEIIFMANAGAPGFANDVPTDTIETAGDGRVLIGIVPEPTSMALIAIGTAFGVLRLRRRRARGR